jgi:hypothetical protein
VCGKWAAKLEPHQQKRLYLPSSRTRFFVNFQFVLFMCQLEKVKGPEQRVFCCKKSTKSSRHEIPPPLPSQQQFKKFKVGTKILPYFSLFSHFAHNLKTVLRIRIQDPGSGAFLTPGSGIRNRFFPDPGSQTHMFESSVKIFW